MMLLALKWVIVICIWVFMLIVLGLMYLICEVPIVISKKNDEAKRKKKEQEKIQAEEKKRRKEESIMSVLKPKYQSNPNLNKMFDDCVNDIISCCKKAQNILIAKKGSKASIMFHIIVSRNDISVSPDEEWCFDFGGSYLHFVDYGIIPLKGDNVDVKTLAIKELLSERLCSEIAKIDSNFKAKPNKPNGSYVYVTITNEPQGVEL